MQSRINIPLQSMALVAIIAGCGHVASRRLRDVQVIDVRSQQPVTITTSQARPRILVFWATYCPPCREELPALQRLYESVQPKGIDVVAVSVDRISLQAVRRFVDYYRLTFPVYYDPGGAAASSIGIVGVPQTFITDSQGSVHELFGEVDWDSAEMRAEIQRLVTGVLVTRQSTHD